MWICPKCGERNEDHFEQCWSCVSEALEQDAPGAADPPPRPLRSLGSILFRVLIGFLIGTLVGVAIFHRNGATLAEATASGAIVGVVAGCIVGVFVWAVFPYHPEAGARNRSEPEA